MNIRDSARLSYQMMTADDADLMLALDSDPQVMRYINGGKTPTMKEIIEVSIPRLAKYHNVIKGWGLWKVTVKEDQQFIGWILVRPMDFFNENVNENDLELGWRFMRNSWGKGYATEAAIAIRDVFAAKEEITRLSSIAIEDNVASISIMTKLGMEFTKTDIYSDPLLGELEVVYYHLEV